MPVTAVDDGFPGRTERLHFFELFFSCVGIATALLTYWWLVD